MAGFKLNLLCGTESVRFGDIPQMLAEALHSTPGKEQDFLKKICHRDLVLAERKGEIVPRNPMSFCPDQGWDIGEYGKSRIILIDNFLDYLADREFSVNWMDAKEQCLQ